MRAHSFGWSAARVCLALVVLAGMLDLKAAGSPATETLAAQERPLVERGRIGSIALGARAETIYNEFRDRARLVDLKLEGHLSPALEVKLFGDHAAPSLVAELSPRDNQLVVTRIRVLDPRLRTKEGIGVGSTYADLRQHYSIDSVGPGEGDFFARVEALGMSFSLDMTAVSPARTIRTPAAVPPSARVVGMLLTR